MGLVLYKMVFLPYHTTKLQPTLTHTVSFVPRKALLRAPFQLSLHVYATGRPAFNGFNFVKIGVRLAKLMLIKKLLHSPLKKLPHVVHPEVPPNSSLSGLPNWVEQFYCTKKALSVPEIRVFVHNGYFVLNCIIWRKFSKSIYGQVCWGFWKFAKN